MLSFTATIKQFAENGDKTGWTYIEVPQDIAEQLKSDNRKSFRVKGKLDDFVISGVALMPMKSGNFLMAINAAMRKGTHKKKGAMLKVQLALDKKPIALPEGFMESLENEPEAKAFFDQLKLSHRNYFIKWVSGVKSEAAVAKRISQMITALLRKQDFGQMMRSAKEVGR